MSPVPNGYPLSAAGVALSGSTTPPPVLPATIAGDRIFGHWRMTDSGVVAPAGTVFPSGATSSDAPVWVQGSDNYNCMLRNDISGIPCQYADDVIDGYPGLSVPGTNGPGASFLQQFGVRYDSGDRPSMWLLARLTGLGDSDEVSWASLLLASGGQSAGFLSQPVGGGTGYNTLHQIFCRMNYVGDGGTPAEIAVAHEVPAQSAHLYALHYNADNGLFEIDNEQYVVPTGGAVPPHWAGGGFNGVLAGSIASEDAGAIEVVDWCWGINLTSLEQESIKTGYFGRRYPSLRLA